MISYMPMRDYFRKHHITAAMLNEKGIGGVYESIRHGRYIQVCTLEKIINITGCSVYDLIAWVPGKQQSEDCKLDWNKFNKVLEEKGTTKSQVSIQAGRARTYLHTVYNRNGSVSVSFIYEICKILDCKPEDICE